MGNRATVIFTDGKKEFSPAVYLHWNGGPESIYGFLEELDRRQIRADQFYECARFIQIVGEFFNNGDRMEGLSLGVSNGPKSDKPKDLDKVQTDHGDNGFYLVNRTGGTLKMRRFTEENGRAVNGDWVSDIVEHSPEMVEDERKQAETHKYRAQFREFFTELTKGKIIQAA